MYIMTIFDLFSKRQKRLRGDVPDVYTYDSIPEPLRVQIVHIWEDAIGNETLYYNDYNRVKSTYKFLVETLCREYGVFQLIGNRNRNRHYMEEIVNFFLREEDNEKTIDTIELSFRAIDKITRDYSYARRDNASKIADNAIYELNARFLEHGVGYQFEEGKIIRVDSQLVHTEVVKPALSLLSSKKYSGAQQEFLKAHEHYRQRNFKEALNEALKAFESTMKAICDKRGWDYDDRATSKTLIDICYKNGLIPTFWQQHMAALRSLLEGGVPTGRNKLSGHGQGAEPIKVPQYIVAYVLHMAASCIVFLVEAEKHK